MSRREVHRSKYPTRLLRLGEEGPDRSVLDLTPEERVKMVWELTRQAWTFKDGYWHEPRLCRHVARVIRPAG